MFILLIKYFFLFALTMWWYYLTANMEKVNFFKSLPMECHSVASLSVSVSLCVLNCPHSQLPQFSLIFSPIAFPVYLYPSASPCLVGLLSCLCHISCHVSHFVSHILHTEFSSVIIKKLVTYPQNAALLLSSNLTI